MAIPLICDLPGEIRRDRARRTKKGHRHSGIADICSERRQTVRCAMTRGKRALVDLAAFVVLTSFCLSPKMVVAEIPCVCRYAGQLYELGDCVCMSRFNGLQRACCGMVLNNTSWTFSENGCPVAMLERLGPAENNVAIQIQDHSTPANSPIVEHAIFAK